MPRSLLGFDARRGLVLASLAAGGMLVFLATQPGQGADPPPRIRHEYATQEVRADVLPKTLNELDAQGWEPVQIVPLWTIENENGTPKLLPKTYEVVTKRAMGVK